MMRRLGYKGYVIEARSHEVKDGGFSAEFSVEEHEARGVVTIHSRKIAKMFGTIKHSSTCRRLASGVSC
jgi:hypothetical protein